MKYTLLLIPILIVGCSATPLKQEAARIRIVTHEPSHCEYLGEVTGNQGGSLSGKWTTNADLETGARNDMKNKAYEMGGNVIHMLGNRAGQTGRFGLYGGSSDQTDVTYTGAVYKCSKIVASSHKRQVTVGDNELDP